MRTRPSDLGYVLLGRVISRVLRGYIRDELRRSGRKLVVAGVGGAAGMTLATVLIRHRRAGDEFRHGRRS